MAKDDLIERAKELGVPLEGGETVAQLRALIEQAEAQPAPVAKTTLRLRSVRRVRMILADLDRALGQAAADLAPMIYPVRDGQRVGDWQGVADISAFQEHLRGLNNALNQDGGNA